MGEREKVSSAVLRAFKLSVKPGFISDLFTPGKQLTGETLSHVTVCGVYFKQTKSRSVSSN